jgi:hypothetical protein
LSALIGKKIANWALEELLVPQPYLFKLILTTWEYTKGVAEVTSWGVGAAYNVALHCVGREIELVPATAKRTAGETQLYNLQVKNGEKKVIGAVQPDRMRIQTGECTWGSPDWSCYGEVVGPDRVTAEFGYLPVATSTLTVTPGKLHSLTLSPRSSEIRVDEPTSVFLIAGKDFFGNEVQTSIGVGHSEAHLSIVPEGECSDLLRTCTAYRAGRHAVTVTQGNVSDVVEVQVRDNVLRLTPEAGEVPAGEPQAYSAEEVTWKGEVVRPTVEFGGGPNEATLTISPDGSCDQIAGTCTPSVAGPHTVRASTERLSAEASLIARQEGEEEGGGDSASYLYWSGTISLDWGLEQLSLPGDRERGEAEWKVAVLTYGGSTVEAGIPFNYETTWSYLAEGHNTDTSQGCGFGSLITKYEAGLEGTYVFAGGGTQNELLTLVIHPDSYRVALGTPPGEFSNKIYLCNGSLYKETHGSVSLFSLFTCGGAASVTPLPRQGTRIVAAMDGVSCGKIFEGSKYHLALDLTVVCVDTNEAPDGNWECPDSSSAQPATSARSTLGA